MTDMEMKRAFVSDLYSGPSWKRRVANMSDANVIAIYIREQNKKGEPVQHPKKESSDGPPPF